MRIVSGLCRSSQLFMLPITLLVYDHVINHDLVVLDLMGVCNVIVAMNDRADHCSNGHVIAIMCDYESVRIILG